LCLYGVSMGTPKKPLRQPPRPEPVSIKAARARFGSFVDHVAEGHPALICRGSTPLAVVVPAAQYEELIETVRRDQSLEAVLRARGVAVSEWTTTEVLEAVVRLLEDGRS
jgi:prevent-host-death family protein